MRCASPPRAEFEQEALRHLSELRATALRFARNERDAEDLVQETLLRAFSAWESFQAGTNCRAWLFRILTNNFINEYRRIARERIWAWHDEPFVSASRRHAAQNPEATLFERLLGDEVVSALSELPDEFRRVVILADLEGLSYREVATKLGCPLGTVMSRLYRARRILEAELWDYARELGIASCGPSARRSLPDAAAA
jgi:RNA polymerase sigma-70 factor (ECF subfamily)